MIETWIDNLCGVWEFTAPGFNMVKSFTLIERAEFPSSVTPEMIALNPVALTIPSMVQPKYSMGNKHLTWYGTTEFHVYPDLDWARYPSMMPWYGIILRAAASHVQLGGTVGNFVILDHMDALVGPVNVAYGDETPHWGFRVQWMVEENPGSADLPVSA